MSSIELQSTLQNNKSFIVLMPKAIKPLNNVITPNANIFKESKINKNKNKLLINNNSYSAFKIYKKESILEQSNIQQYRARKGQQIWKNIYKILRIEFNELIYKKDNITITFDKNIKNKNRCIYMYLEMCEINGLIDIIRSDNKMELITQKNMKGFIGITKISIKNIETYGWEFFNRLVLMKRGIWEPFNKTSINNKEKLELKPGELNTIHNIFRNIKFTPSSIGKWEDAFQGKEHFLYNE